jgi:putative ABC transport system substrate-binding protein
VVFVDPTNFSSVAGWEETRRAAEAASVEITRVDLGSADDLQSAFESPTMDRVQAIHNHASALLLPVREPFAELALQRRLPASDINGRYAEAGLLLAYGSNVLANSRRAATFLEKILKGARPGELPVEQPTTFDLVVNARTATALGITIPPNVATQVTEWVQ